MNVNKTLIALGIAAGSLAATMTPAAAADVYVRIEPPAPRHEVVVEKHGYVWIPGYWSWNGHRYGWVDGHSVRARHSEHWVPDRWVEDRGQWHREHGRWERG